jgi:hypothetical protein
MGRGGLFGKLNSRDDCFKKEIFEFWANVVQ